MESYEATKQVFSRIQTIDPQNASKIMGYILLNHGEKDMIRFAYGPETLIISMANKALLDLGLSSNSPPSLGPTCSNPIPISRPNPLSLSPRFNPSSPLWSPHHHNHSPSYASVLNNGGTTNSSGGPTRESFGEDFHHFSDQNLNFLSDQQKSLDFYENSMDLSLSPGCRSDSMVYPYWENSNNGENSINNNNNNNININNNNNFHRRSVSFNDMYYGSDDSSCGFGSKPCLYYARGSCKNGTTCKFIHGFNDDNNISININDNINNNNNNSGGVGVGLVGSPSKFDAFEPCQEEIFRSKFAHQQRIAAHFLSGGLNLPCNKFNFLPSDSQRSAAAALMMGEEFHKLNRVRMARNEFLGLDSNPGSRQIYLTFPADSTFKEEDVSNYFNLYGPVQDVRIPYQQKRMFGFVTFVYPETVKLILAKGNPHFVCDSRVLVKPYKEKSKLPDKKQHQHTLERGEFSQCSSPSGLECRDPFDFRHGGRMMFSTKEMLLRRKLEEADLQQAIELQGRRLMNLQFLDLKNYQNHHGTSVGSPILSPSVPQAQSSPSATNGFAQDVFEESNGSPTGVSDEQVVVDGVNGALSDCNGNAQNNEGDDDNKPKIEESELSESGLEHILPDNLFASPKKSASEQRTSLFLPEFDNVAPMPASSNNSSESSMPASSPLSLPPHKSCFFEMPRLSTGQGALEL